MELPNILAVFSLAGQVAIVTGGGRGIGRAICIGYAAAGAHVIPVARTASEIEVVAGQIRDMGVQALPLPCDVTKASEIDRVVKTVVERFGRIDILVNNAGGARFVADPSDIRDDGWDKGIDLNLKSVFLFSKAVGRVMLKQGRGKIINVTSIIGLKPGPNMAYYGAAKAGANSLTQSLAVAWGPKGVYVNAIAPGGVETSLSEWRRQGRAKLGLPPEEVHLFAKHMPPVGEGRGTPEDLVPLAIFLASSASDFITGEIIGPGEVAVERTLG